MATDVENRIAALYDTVFWISPGLNPNLGKAEPPANVKVVGLLAYADGVNWNPGLGAGVFVWNGSAWKEFYGTWNLTPYTGPTTQVSAAPYPAAPSSTSRALNTVYQNVTGKPLFLRVNCSSTSVTGIYIYSDASNPPTVQVDFVNPQTASEMESVFWIILPGNYYKIYVSAGTPTLNAWIEEY